MQTESTIRIEHAHHTSIDRDSPRPSSQTKPHIVLAVGADLDDTLVRFGRQEDCIGCSTTPAAPGTTSDDVIAKVLRIFSPLATHDPTVRPRSKTMGLLRWRSAWTEVDIDARSQRLHSVKMPAELVGAQRLLAINDLRGDRSLRPTIAIGLWSLFAHPLVRTGAEVAGARDGLTAEIALAVHPDHYVIIDQDRSDGFTVVVETPDPIAAELIVLSLRQEHARMRGAGPWEDPLVQAATEIDLGVRTLGQIDIDSRISPALAREQHQFIDATIRSAAEAIGIQLSR